MSEVDTCRSGSVNETNALEGLPDAFASAFSIEEIDRAYYKAGGDADSVAEILSGWQNENSSNVSWTSDLRTSSSKGECNLASSRELPCERRFDNLARKGEHFGSRSPELFNNGLDRQTHLIKHNRPKQKKISYSIGTVSSVLGKGYAKPPPPSNGVCKVTKPLRVEVKEDDLREDVSVSNAVPRSELIRNKDVEEFLFSVLGKGFLLGKDVIREVLSQCGYDAKKTMNTLQDLSTEALDGRDVSTRDVLLNNVACSSEESEASEKAQQIKDLSHRNTTEALFMENDKQNLSRALLESWFAVHERCEEIPRKNRRVRAVKKKAIGQTVTAPFTDFDEEISPSIVKLQSPEIAFDDEEDEYQLLRRAAKQNWSVKWKYFEAALDAFLEGNRALANYFIGEANSYHERAREADEKSSGVILETSEKKGATDLVSIDVREHRSKDAIKLLKHHLKWLSGINNVRILKVILGSGDEDITRSTRKRKNVLGLSATGEKPVVEKWPTVDGKYHSAGASGEGIHQVDRRGGESWNHINPVG